MGGTGGIPPLCSRRMTRYAALSRDEVPDNLAMMFITFPAAKDPTYEQRHPGTPGGAPGPPSSSLRARGLLNPLGTGWAPPPPPLGDVTGCPRPADKSCMTILTMARYEWFEEWAGSRPRHRGPEYQRYKMDIAQRLLDRALLRFPHLRDKVGVSHRAEVPTRAPWCPLARREPPVLPRWSSWRRRRR